jgi:hypothetical protein
LIEDFAHSTLQLSDTPVDLEFMDKLPASSYGFPCGFHKDFLGERARIPESLFDLRCLSGHETTKHTYMDVSQVAITSCGMCNIDMRPVRFRLILFLINFSNFTLIFSLLVATHSLWALLSG